MLKKNLFFLKSTLLLFFAQTDPNLTKWFWTSQTGNLIQIDNFFAFEQTILNIWCYQIE